MHEVYEQVVSFWALRLLGFRDLGLQGFSSWRLEDIEKSHILDQSKP